ncbi:MAG: TraR/DksA C4-type zinc finger protein [Methanobacterium sp.]|uniref:FmdE family protein n=1 Tax=Methanobacterium sp. TaxID=2164 RepID=UPI003D65BACC|nr:TraR/DksA C4-type zinc finger protein [Methanobacterium sp.]
MSDLKNSKSVNSKIKPFSEVTEFHGHVCPGSAIGYRAAEVAIEELSSKKAYDEELICITENDTCAVDAIQVVTGCTFGKGNLIFHDYGKQAYTFINRETEDAVRVSLKDSFSVDKIDPMLNKLRRKVNSGQASLEDKENLKIHVDKASMEILNLPAKEMFNIEHVKAEIPKKARLFESLECHECGEITSKHRLKEINGELLCIPCYNKHKGI